MEETYMTWGLLRTHCEDYGAVSHPLRKITRAWNWHLRCLLRDSPRPATPLLFASRAAAREFAAGPTAGFLQLGSGRYTPRRVRVVIETR